MSKVTVITGAGAGVGRATVEEFARNGYDVALLSRDPDRLERDVADAAAVEAAANRVESELGPVDVWVNVAMATIFAPVSDITPEDLERGTKVPTSDRSMARWLR